METDRLLLIPVDIKMIDTLLVSNEVFYHDYGYLNDAGEYLTPSPDYLHKIKNRQIEHPEEYPLAVDYLIILKSCRAVIGTIYYKYLPQMGTSEIGYGMNPKYEHNGYMKEALTSMLEYGKNNGIRTVIADTEINNIKSQNVLIRCGFKYQGESNGLRLFSIDL